MFNKSLKIGITYDVLVEIVNFQCIPINFSLEFKSYQYTYKKQNLTEFRKVLFFKGFSFGVWNFKPKNYE